MKDPFQIIKAPIITEQSYSLTDKGKYVFEVSVDANKNEVKKAIEKAFSVKVMKVNILNVHGKARRLRFKMGITPAWKKAVITIQEGQKIELF